MCGIFGFVSKKPQPVSQVVSALFALEYRGYDSWGIAAKAENLSSKDKKSRIMVEKKTGKIGNSAIFKSSFTDLKSKLSIGHTRWATHGGVTIENAHPHLDCTRTLALVHNGIFENYEDVRKILEKKNHKFTSQTDTEIIVHLIEEYYKIYPLPTAIQKAFNLLQGLNAIVVMDLKSNSIIALKSGSPLLLGVGPETLYVASDVSAIIPYTAKIVVLEDDQMAILKDKLEIQSIFDGHKIKIRTEDFSHIKKDGGKDKYRHYLLKEINEQPKILASIYKIEKENTEKVSNEIRKAFGTFMLGCGTASYAALAGEYYFSKIAKKHINFSVGSEFKYIQDFITDKSLIVPISQSGETIDVVEPVQKARKKGAKVVSIVNVSTSTLARLSEFSVNLNAGVEKAVVGTKSFTSMAAILLAIAYTVAGNPEEAERLLTKTSTDVKRIISKSSVETIKKLAKKLKQKNNAFLIGRGISYVAALEGALKLKETALVHAEGFAGGELKHGVIALVEKGTPCFVFAPADETYDEIISNAQEIKARGGLIIGVGPKQNSVFDVFLKTADLGPATLISQTVYMQLLAYYLALERGIEDPDKPRNLAKSVTVK